MELIYPFVIYIGVPLLIFLFVFKFKKSNTYTNGKKVANTKYIKKVPYYQEVMKKYKILSYSIKGLCFISILSSILLLARPASTDNNESSMYNRDIFLCMDVSNSVLKLNEEIVKELKTIVENLKGERFGISIFNTTSVLLVPLTDDYDYVLRVLDELEQSFNVNNNYSTNQEYSFYTRNYILEGTLIGGETRGGSLIGDGLASAIYSFSNMEENRTRVVIFSSDNELYGTPLVTTAEAAEIAKSKNVTVYGIAPEAIEDLQKNEKTELERAVKSTRRRTLYRIFWNYNTKHNSKYRRKTKNINTRTKRNKENRPAANSVCDTCHINNIIIYSK